MNVASGCALVCDADGNPIPGLMTTAFITSSTAGAPVASVAASATKRHVVTDIFCSTDKAATLVELKSDTTVLAQLVINTTAPLVHKFGTPVILAANKTVNLAVTGTTAAYANMTGYSILI